MGKRFNTNEDIVARDEDGKVIRTSCVKLLPLDLLKWETVEAITGTPWDPSAKAENFNGEIARPSFEETGGDQATGPIDVPPPPRVQTPTPRSVRITPDMVKKLGYSERCGEL